MSAAEFCIWLKILLDGRNGPLTRDEITAIRQRLGDVFIHEIDPAMGSAAHQRALNEVHKGETS
ncbi:MAG: hypothetical protein JWR80_5220 [Bradyrhizobium sp.]|nr:hypothetical protein [Bradyrhizobium sp.]